MRAVADQEPPLTSNLRKQAQFYYKRGETADHLGRGRQAISDYRKSVDFAGRAGMREAQYRANQSYGRAELNFGNWSRGIETLDEAIKQASGNTFAVAMRLSLLAGVRAYGGEIGAAEKNLNRARPLLSEVLGRGSPMDVANGLPTDAMRAATLTVSPQTSN